jgi:hypothetical protein
MRNVIGKNRCRRGIAPTWMAGRDLVEEISLFAPHEQAPLRTLGGEGIESSKMGSAIEKFGVRFFFGTTHGDRAASDNMGYRGGWIVEVTDKNSLGRADDDAGRFEPHIEPMGAKVALLGCMILWIDKDGVIGTGRDACFTANTNSFVEIDYTVRPGVHRPRWAGIGARWVLALVTTGDLEGASCMGKDANVNILDIGAIDRQRNLIFGFASRTTRVAADTFTLVNDFRPGD